jgi:MoaA/NifB/PqqE/SkfB family radical SAM enzyme
MSDPVQKRKFSAERGPALVAMAITSRCNLKCVMCEHSMMKVEKKDFDLSLVDRMGDFLATALMVDLTGLGDPLLSNTFWEVLDRYPLTHAEDREFFLGFSTNGTRLTPGNIERLLRSRIRTIRVSIDAADQNTFREIRKTDLDPILEGTRRLIEARNAAKRQFPRVGLHMTWMQKTLHGVPAMIDLSKELGADFLDVFPIHERSSGTLDTWVQLDGGSYNYRDNLLSGVPEPDLERIVGEFHSYAKSKSQPIQSTLSGLEGRKSIDYPVDDLDWGDRVDAIDWNDHSIRCPMPFLEMFVHYEGAVHPCCWSLQPAGNLRDATLEEIWKGDTMSEVRNDLVAGQVPKLCEGAACPFVKGKSDAASDLVVSKLVGNIWSKDSYTGYSIELSSVIGSFASGSGIYALESHEGRPLRWTNGAAEFHAAPLIASGPVSLAVKLWHIWDAKVTISVNGAKALCVHLPPQGLDANIDLGFFNAGTSLVVRIDCPARKSPGDARQLGVPIESLRLISGAQSRPLPTAEQNSLSGNAILG